jgi:hypothetical protein
MNIETRELACEVLPNRPLALELAGLSPVIQVPNYLFIGKGPDFYPDLVR